MLSSRATGYTFALLTAALWSLIGPLSRICFAEGLGPLEVAFWRALSGGVCFALHAAFHRELRVPVAHGALFCGFGLIGVSLFFAAFQMSVQAGGVALAVVLMYTAPIWVALFSRILFHEQLSSRKLFALGIALVGTMLVSFSGGSSGAVNPTLGVICGLASGFFYATHYPFYVWWKERYSTATLYAWMLLAGALALLPFVDFAPSRSLLVWGVLLSLGVITTYGAYLCYGVGLRRISPVRVSVISNLEPVLGTLLAWLCWNEHLLPLGWTGGVLVIGAVFILTLDASGK